MQTYIENTPYFGMLRLIVAFFRGWNRYFWYFLEVEWKMFENFLVFV